MELINKYVVFPVGFFYYGSIFTFLAAFCIPYLASQTTEMKADNNSSRPADGSGQGSLKDILGFSDDDSTYDEADDDRRVDDGVDDFDDDGSRGFVRGSAAEPDTKSEDLSTPLYSLKARCFRCHGDGINGCDVSSMVQYAEMYTVSCVGKCLNLSSGSTSVYDCAQDMQTNMDTCFQNGQTKMCFCTGDFCNGPSNAWELDINITTPYSNATYPMSLDKDPYNYTDPSDITFEMNNAITNESKGHISEYTKLNESNVEIHDLFEASQNDSTSYEYELFSEESEDQSLNYSNQFEQIDIDGIDFIIPRGNLTLIENSSSSKVGSPNVVDINNLRVGNLKDRGLETGSADHNLSGAAINTAFVVMCGVLILQNVQ